MIVLYFTIYFTVPEAPTNVSAIAVSSTIIQLSWSAPVTANGILLNYTVILISSNNFSSINFSNNDSFEIVYVNVYSNNTFGDTIAGLNEDTEYIFAIYADTIAGSGDVAIDTERTFEDRK